MIPVVHTRWLNKEVETDGHSPMYFLCDDGNYYYCKYRTQFKREELDCLVYEIVCQFLLKKLRIPTPDIALAVIEKDSYDRKKLHKNKLYVHPGITCFASKEAPNTALVMGIQSISKKSEANKFESIYDLLKIAMFDLWVENDDRGRGSKENYNLLLQTVRVQNNETGRASTKFRWLAFDHAFTFGGVPNLRIFNKTMMPSLAFKLIESQYFKSFKKYFAPSVYEGIVENFLALQPYEIETIIQSVFKQIPAEWESQKNLGDRIIEFLSDSKRIHSVKQLTMHSLKN
jgi:hypothetical protein